MQPVGDGTFSYGLDLEILERVNSPEPEGPAPAAEFLSPEYQSALEACGSRKTLTAKYQNYLAMVSDRDQLVGSIFQDEVMTSAANARRTGKPSPSKPLGAVVTERTGRGS